jgi:serine/threonine protein kinase
LADFTKNEIQTLQNIKNDNIIGFVEMLRTLNNLYLVYEFCNGGNLDEAIKKTGVMKEVQCLEYFG